MATNKKTFTVDGTEYAVRLPNTAEKNEAQSVYNKAFRRIVAGEGFIKAEVDVMLRSRKLWNDDMDTKFRKLLTDITDNEMKLATGGIRLSEMREICFDIRRARNELTELTLIRSSLDDMTAENQAEQDKFNYLVSKCTVYNESGDPVFSNVENFVERATEPVAIEAAKTLIELIYGRDTDVQKKYPENKLLLQYGFVDDQLRPIDEKKRLISLDGKLIDENNRYINEAGEFVDYDGRRVDEDGNPIIEFTAFIDDRKVPDVSEPEKIAHKGPKEKVRVGK